MGVTRQARPERECDLRLKVDNLLGVRRIRSRVKSGSERAQSKAATDHSVGVRARDGEDEPPHDAPRKPFRIRLNERAYDAAVETSNHDAQHRPLDEEERV